ncbi:MAG: hypothetical protein IJT75_05485, partial [Bacteroidaceae bacterium]|nr:hypothetical protein [Bacteroidaceae bacterium]
RVDELKVETTDESEKGHRKERKRDIGKNGKERKSSRKESVKSVESVFRENGRSRIVSGAF